MCNKLTILFLTDYVVGSRYVPTLTFDGASVTVADTRTRENCLRGYMFLLDSANMVIFQPMRIILWNYAWIIGHKQYPFLLWSNPMMWFSSKVVKDYQWYDSSVVNFLVFVLLEWWKSSILGATLRKFVYHVSIISDKWQLILQPAPPKGDVLLFVMRLHHNRLLDVKTYLFFVL